MLRLTRMGKEEKSRSKLERLEQDRQDEENKIRTILNLKSNKEAGEYMGSVSQDVFGIEEFREIHLIEVLEEVIRID